ncbi:MAG: hypothetical protein B7Z66_02920 [Chromatiales bacterium 21-64-14]|nr:MAG: hypothetical protein B7Z66_02920 [Chromatiales bacterium 21-64-14]HQU15717.1 DNA polymerase Y family protein [Gammaproteobacteria bacterium]
MLWLCLHLPHLSLEIFTRGACLDPVSRVVSDAHNRRPRVLDCNPAAAVRGVRPGMTVGTAHALAPDLVVWPRAREAERRVLQQLAGWAGQFSPMVSLAPPHELVLEVEGSCGLFGGRDRLVDAVYRGVTGLGHQVVWALAPTPLGATLLARGGREVQVIARSQLRGMLARLPLGTLNLSPPVRAALHGLGMRSLGDCLRLPRDGLVRRAGPDLLKALDRALGDAPDPREPYVPPPRFVGRLPLPAAVEETGALLFAVHRLILELSGFLAARDAGVRELRFHMMHGVRSGTEVALRLTAPSRDPGHLLGLMRVRLERVALPAPVQEIVLRANPVTLPRRDGSLFPGGAVDAVDAGDAAALVERLRARLGEPAVHGLRRVAEHRPERAWDACDVTAGDRGDTVLPVMTHARDPCGTSGLPPRPLWLLPRPAPLAVRNGRPCRDGTLSLGPERERIESGWWDGADVVRDYFVARTVRGERLWIFRAPGIPDRWFLHGIFE